MVLNAMVNCIQADSQIAPLLPTEQSESSLSFETISFDDQDYLDFFNEYLESADLEHISRVIEPIQIMIFLERLGIPELLDEPIFLHTNRLNKRSLLDQPLFEPDRAEFPGKWVIGSSAFLRKTNRSNFTKHSDKLKSYIALAEQSLIDKLENSIDQANILSPGLEIEIAKILSLFENMTVEERQAGFMMHLMKRWRTTTFRMMFPLYYAENNFSLTKREQDEVARVLGRPAPEEEERFRKRHFISDKIGMGDTRIEIDHVFFKRPSGTLRGGGLATIPTAWTWGGGFLGSLFAKPSTLPIFELEPIFNAIDSQSPEAEQEAFIILNNFLLNAFDRFAANLIDVPLGNNHHLGLGLYLRGKIPLDYYINTSFAHRIKLASRTSIELFLPATEKRFYINKIDEEGFSNHNFKDNEQAAENLQFLKEQAVARIFLRAFDTRIIPGVIFRWNGGAYYQGERFGFNLGTDFWLQNKARISKIYVPQKTKNEIDIPKAKQPVAYQGKIFGGIVFKDKTDKRSWYFSLNADASLYERGLGQDYSVSFNFEANF